MRSQNIKHPFRWAIMVLIALGVCPYHLSAQAPWPGQVGNLVGYHNYGDGVLGTSACPAVSGGTAANPTVISKCKYTGTVTVSVQHVIFRQVDFNGNGNAGAVSITSGASDITFEGSRFQSNQIQFYNVNDSHTTGLIVYLFDSFTPLASLYATPPGLIWPSAGTAANTLVQTDDVNAVGVNKGYEFGINAAANIGPTIVDHCDFWGFGNAIQLNNGGTNQLTFVSSWYHDGAQATGVTGGGYHTDGPGYLNGGAGPSNVLVQGNTIVSLGNSNGLAFQAATSGYSHINLNYNYLSGFGNTDAPGEPGATHLSNSSHTFNTWSTAVENYFEPVYGGAFPSAGNTIWACNKLAFWAGTTWTNQDSNTPTSAIDGKYWLPAHFSNTSSFASTTDNASNAICDQVGPSSLDFVDQSVSSTSAKQTITLSSTNTGTVTVSSLSLSGTNSGDYALATAASNPCSATPITIASGSSCNLAVTFTPSAQGPRSATLSITDNMGAPASPQTVPLIGVGTPAGAASFSCSPSTIPAHHSGNITLTCTGSGTTWNGSTAFSVSGVTGAAFVSKANTTATAETVVVTTGSGTGTLTITDSTDSITTTINVSTATVTISPTTGAPGAGGCTVTCRATITLTGTNTLWTTETAAGLFTESGGTGASIGTPTVTTDTAATALLTWGSAGASETITDASTTATATFTVSSPTTATVTTGTASTPTATTNSVLGSSYVCTGSCSAVTSEGVCYSTTNPPTSPCTSDGTASPFDSTTLTGLAVNTLYFYRAFATNSGGTAFGSVGTFVTPPILYVTGAGTSGSSVGNTFTFNYTATNTNNAVVFGVFCHGASLPNAATLTASGWTISSLIGATSNGTATGALFGAIAPNTSAATFTATFSNGAAIPCNSFDAYMIGEFIGNNTSGGVVTFDATGASGASSGGCNQSAANVTPTSNNNAVWNGCFAAAIGVPVLPWLAGATDGAGGDVSEYQILSGGAFTPQTPSYTSTSGSYVVLDVSIAPPQSSTPNTNWMALVSPAPALGMFADLQ